VLLSCKVCWKRWSFVNLKFYLDICLKGIQIWEDTLFLNIDIYRMIFDRFNFYRKWYYFPLFVCNPFGIVFWLWVDYEGIEVQFPALQKWCFSSATRPHRLWKPSSLPLSEYQGLFLLEKSAGNWSSPITLFSDEFENAWSYDSIPTYAFIVCC
jgi:hypothetical protein